MCLREAEGRVTRRRKNLSTFIHFLFAVVFRVGGAKRRLRLDFCVMRYASSIVLCPAGFTRCWACDFVCFYSDVAIFHSFVLYSLFLDWFFSGSLQHKCDKTPTNFSLIVHTEEKKRNSHNFQLFSFTDFLHLIKNCTWFFDICTGFFSEFFK